MMCCKLKGLFKILIVVFASTRSEFYTTLDKSLRSAKSFKKVRDSGDSLAYEDIISSHNVHSKVECALKCLQEPYCVGYNYKRTHYTNKTNCQVSQSKVGTAENKLKNGMWVFYQDLETLITQSGLFVDGWTLIARFSNNDSKNWMTEDGLFWYDEVTPYGDVNKPFKNTDMIAEAFWKLKGHEMKITRSDDSKHTGLLQTTSNCLQGSTFRSKISGYGNFRNGAIWSSNECLGRCPVIYGGQYKTTFGFEQHDCKGNIQDKDFVGFWCDYKHGDGSVIMIGGGGKGCNRADHGIGITEEDEAKFGNGNSPAFDFFDFGNNVNAGGITSNYSLNLWIR